MTIVITERVTASQSSSSKLDRESGVKAGISALPFLKGGAAATLANAKIGGSLHVTGGHMAAAGTRRQRDRGIEDTPEEHLEDIRRISHGTAREDLIGVLVRHAADTIEWLQDHDFAFASETPRIVYGHEPYRIARTYYGRDEGISILEVLRAELERTQADCHLTLWTNAAVTELRQDGSGRVVGVSVVLGSGEVAVQADAVVLTTGGFGADPELFLELEGTPLVSAAARTSTGDGLHLGMAVGAAIQGQGTYLPTFGGLPDPRSPGRANWSDRQRLTSERPPHEIYVNKEGRRWVAEDEPSIDEKERALTKITDQTFWTVFDDAALALSTGGMNQMIVGLEPHAVRTVMNTRPGLHSAPSLAALADLAGIDRDGLVETVASYNLAVEAGVDADLGRTYLPAPIIKSPFYAVRNHAITLVTFQGLDIDETFAVRDQAGQLIPGLYAAGEVIGAGATCGNSFCSGMLVTPALTFGRLLGTRLGGC